METPTGEFFYRLASGESFEAEVHPGYQVAVRICVPPFPFDDEKTFDESSRDAAIVFDNSDREGIHIEDTRTVDGQWRVAGESGTACIATGKGETMQEARDEVYDRIDGITLPNKYYRDDIGERWIDGDGDRLQSWGYLGPSSDIS